MPATVQLNTRIDPEVKRRGDIVFARAGLTPSDVVRAVWNSAAQTQQVPECVMPHPSESDRHASIREGRGLAYAVMRDLGIAITPGRGSDSAGYDYESLRDEYYDDMDLAMEKSHA